MFFLLGTPYALLALPRKDWRDRVMVICVALVFGPALLTTWMFILGTIGGVNQTALLRFDLVFGGTVVLALLGWTLVWRKNIATREIGEDYLRNNPNKPLQIDEKLLLILITAAIILRWFTTAYWPFTAYDELWVYGYEGKLYTLLGYIPQHIDYYPQFLPLQFTYMQLAYGGVNDHAARAVIPFLHIGSIVAVYLLGSRLFNRRAGIIGAALWALYPHVGEWAHVGDLEIVQTFLLTAMAAFFFMAWTGQEPRRLYALIAGLLFGVALWTKPTAGGFVWGVLLLVALELARVRFNWRALWPRFEVALITGLACLPLGSVWYIRNLLFGHPPIALPHPFWLTLAQRSGVEFGWPLLAVGMVVAYFIFGRSSNQVAARKRSFQLLLGIGLILLGLLPSIFTPHRMEWLEWAALITGAGVLVVVLQQYAWTIEERNVGKTLLWMEAFALPYFATWFYSYSYHYRLSFAIVPLMLMPIAVILACWLKPERMYRLARVGYLAVIVAISVPGVVITLHDYGGGWDWLWTDKYPDDFARYMSENPSLMIAAAALQDYVNATGKQPMIVAPGAELLPFFFPLAEIRNTETPTRLSELGTATHYVYSRHAQWRYDDAGIKPENNQLVSALGRQDLFKQVVAHDDGNFFYEVYEILPFDRFRQPEMAYTLPEEVTLGGYIRYVGANVHSLVFTGDQRILYEIAWEVLDTPPSDYTITIRLVDPQGKEWVNWDAPIGEFTHGHYAAPLWERGEFILDRRYLQLPLDTVPPGKDYRILIGLADMQTGRPIPVTIDGTPAGNAFDIRGSFEVR
jgi:4-amino-4-deoxy-L-arabinose transferase-like glycosyltransferase